MWKYNYDKLSAISLIKSKRKCVEINLGFMVQLGKWEDFLHMKKRSKKIFNFGGQGQISLIDQTEISSYKESDFDNKIFSISLLLVGDKFLKIIFCNDKELNEKVEKFIFLLQTYEKFPNEYISMYIDTNMLNKSFFEIQIEEIAKCS